MDTPRPKRRHRRLQFGLRKLLLWMGMVALYLGIVKWLDLGTLFAVLLAVLMCLIGLSESVTKNPSNLRWWHFRPRSPIVVGAFLGGTLPLILVMRFPHFVKPLPYWFTVAIELSDGLLATFPGHLFLGVVTGVIVGLLVELLFPPEL